MKISLPVNITYFYGRIKTKIERTVIDSHSFFNKDKSYFANKRGAAILCYHGVTLDGSKILNMRNYSINNLEQHFKIFKEYFNVITIKDYFESKFVQDKFNIALTFDDGYKNNYKYLRPLIEKYQLPVSIYVTGMNLTKHSYLWADFVDIVSQYSNRQRFSVAGYTFYKVKNRYFTSDGINLNDFIKKNGNFTVKEEIFNKFDDFNGIVSKYDLDDYWQLMNDDEIKELSKSKYITIGSHGFLHNNLGNIPIQDAKLELLKSKDYIQNLIQMHVDEIAFPDGSYTNELTKIALDNGYKYQLALAYNIDTDSKMNFLKNRHGMYPVFSNEYQIFKIPNLG